MSMPIVFQIPKDLVKKVEKAGVLDSDQVYVQYLCQTGEDGEHDPEEEPDDHVRPSHAAFHGQIFKIEDAPIPPLDYGCRCAIRYVAAPESAAAEVLETEADADPTTTIEATEEWLMNHIEEYDQLEALAEEVSPADSIAAVQTLAKKLGIDQPRAIAEMVVDVVKRGGPLRKLNLRAAIKASIK